MSVTNVNVVVLTGNLTHDPELRSAGGGTSVCEMRVAVNGRRKDRNGEWVDKPNFFNVVCFGAQADSCATYLSRGRPVAIEGRLDWREWETDDGHRRQAVQIIANMVQFLGGKNGRGTQDSGGEADRFPAAAESEPVGAGVEEDIPF